VLPNDKILFDIQKITLCSTRLRLTFDKLPLALAGGEG
jgi:hypothetical protein